MNREELSAGGTYAETMLRIERLRVTAIEGRYARCRTTSGGADGREVTFLREDWPIAAGDVISVEYDIERRDTGGPVELVDVSFIRIFEDAEAERPVAAD